MDTWDEKVKEEMGDPTAEEVVDVSPLKQLIVDYVGNKLKPDGEDNTVTVDMCFDVFADEFPEFLLAIAEENFLRGYKQAFADMEATEKQDDQKD